MKSKPTGSMGKKPQQGKAEDVSDIVLYRYMPWDAFEKTISSWSLKATLASNTNDYFEFLPTQSKNSETVNDLVKCARENVAFFCFSKLMSCGALWGNYADEFRGVCMAFHFPIDDKIRTLIHNIKYDCDRLSIGKLGTEEEAIEKVRQLLTTKDISWEYENESRLFYMVEEADEVHDGMFFYQEPMNYFCGVILGARCPYSLEYANILVNKSLEKHNICNHLCKNKDMIITRSAIHPSKFLVTNDVWEDEMTMDKLREKGYIF